MVLYGQSPKPVVFFDRESGQSAAVCQVNTAEEQRENLLWYAPNLLTQLIQTRSFEATVKILPRFEQPGDKALLAITGHTYGYISLKYEGTQGFYAVQCVRGDVTGREYAGEATETVLRRIMIPASEALWMKVAMAEDGSYEFGFSFDGDEFIDLGYTFQARRVPGPAQNWQSPASTMKTSRETAAAILSIFMSNKRGISQ